MPPPPCILKVAPTETGLCLRIEGQGTMHQSPAARDVAIRALEGGATVVVDLSACTYLDSTFLGCLMELFRQFGRAQPPRYFMTGSDGPIKKVIGPTHIDRLIPQLPEAPATSGDWLEVKVQALEKTEHLRHVMHCHRALAMVSGPMQDAFARIADQIDQELSK
jgi:anti-anti-sigma regulatory factor